MKNIIIVSLCLILITSCIGAKKTGNGDSNSSSTIEDGSSFENAIMITATTESAGVDAEYKWLAAHYPSYTMIRQSLHVVEEIPYDVMSIKTSEGEEKDVFFNISNFFGKY